MTLEATLDARVGDEVVFDFRVENAGDSTVELTFSSGKTGDVIVFDDDTNEQVWRWSDGRMFTQMIEQRRLAPGAELTEQYTWKHPSSGTFIAKARLDADREAEAKTTFSV